MLATGKLRNENSIDYHDEKSVSKEKINFNFGKNVEEASKFWIKIHGSLMIFACMGCTSIGVLMPRFYKKNWKRKTFLGKNVWFGVRKI